MNLDFFLTRIGLSSLPEAPLARLAALHRAMTHTVPFENLAILEGKRICLEPEAVWDKVVEKGRGGYCFELNALFARVLEGLDYRVERLIGRVWTTGIPTPPLTHMTLKVTAGGRPYLCDVGFGGGTLREPLPWEMDAVANQAPDAFRLAATDNGETMLARLTADGWQDQYSLLPCTLRPQDYLPANHYTSTHPASYFTRTPVAALSTEDGRITLRGRTFRRVGAQGAAERELADCRELLRVLDEEFGLRGLDAQAVECRLAGVFG